MPEELTNPDGGSCLRTSHRLPSRFSFFQICVSRKPPSGSWCYSPRSSCFQLEWSSIWSGTKSTTSRLTPAAAEDQGTENTDGTRDVLPPPPHLQGPARAPLRRRRRVQAIQPRMDKARPTHFWTSSVCALITAIYWVRRHKEWGMIKLGWGVSS
jgi:hypothetical protein